MHRLLPFCLGAATILIASTAWADDRPRRYVLSDAELDNVTAGLASATVAVAASSSGTGAFAYSSTTFTGSTSPYLDIAFAYGSGLATGSQTQNVDVFGASTAVGASIVNNVMTATTNGTFTDYGTVQALALAFRP
jgi:hypothetical protein